MCSGLFAADCFVSFGNDTDRVLGMDRLNMAEVTDSSGAERLQCLLAIENTTFSGGILSEECTERTATWPSFHNRLVDELAAHPGEVASVRALESVFVVDFLMQCW